jgi:hypothetical protein
MPARFAIVLFAVIAAPLIVACGNGQTKPSLNVIEVQERTSMMSGFYLDPFDDATRNSGLLMSAEDAVAAANKEFGAGMSSNPLDHPGELRLFFGVLMIEPSVSPAGIDLVQNTPVGHAFYVITADRQIACAPGTGGAVREPRPTPTPGPLPACKWEIEVDATTGEAYSLTESPSCVDRPAPVTCR